MKNIPIYTIFKSRQNGPGERDAGGWWPGAKDTVLSWLTAKEAGDAMFLQAKNLERDGHLRVICRKQQDSPYFASITFEQHGSTYQRWVVQEFLGVPDDCPLEGRNYCL